jgi:hypothetical protein
MFLSMTYGKILSNQGSPTQITQVQTTVERALQIRITNLIDIFKRLLRIKDHLLDGIIKLINYHRSDEEEEVMTLNDVTTLHDHRHT